MARTVMTASQPIRKGDTVISVVYPHVVLEFPEPGSGGLECFSSDHVSISERAVSGPKRTQDESSRFCPAWWAIVDSNHGPQSYQDCALTA